jgi:hypothetical protein
MALEWVLKKKIADAVTEVGGTLFGGYVRDAIIHDHGAKEFYTYKADAKKEGLLYRCDGHHHQSFKSRTTVPNDIDCVLDSEDMEKTLFATLQSTRLDVHRVFNRPCAKAYLPRLRVEDGAIGHIRYRIRICPADDSRADLESKLKEYFGPDDIYPFFNSAINKFFRATDVQTKLMPTVRVDVLFFRTPQQLLPPFGVPDFECNSLYMTPDGVIHAQDNGATERRVIDDILHFRAVQYDDEVDVYRVEKMIAKQWKIVPKYKHIVAVWTFLCGGKPCAMCHEALTPDYFERKDYFRLKCCEALYHTKCLREAITHGSACGDGAMIRTNTCIRCEHEVTGIIHDLRVFEVLHRQDTKSPRVAAPSVFSWKASASSSSESS